MLWHRSRNTELKKLHPVLFSGKALTEGGVSVGVSSYSQTSQDESKAVSTHPQ